MNSESIAAAAVEVLSATPTLIVGCFLILPDEMERRRCYRSLGVQTGEMWSIDRAVVREIVATSKGDRYALGPFCN